jgi:hypothetical protein
VGSASCWVRWEICLFILVELMMSVVGCRLSVIGCEFSVVGSRLWVVTGFISIFVNILYSLNLPVPFLFLLSVIDWQLLGRRWCLEID